MVKSLAGWTAAAAAAALSSSLTLVQAHAHEGVGFHIPHAERAMNEVYLANLRARFGEAPARVVNAHLEKRQGVAASTTAAGAAASSTGSAVAGATTMNSTVTMGSIPIGITTTPETTSPLPTTYVAGATAPVQNAPVLPLGECCPVHFHAATHQPIRCWDVNTVAMHRIIPHARERY